MKAKEFKKTSKAFTFVFSDLSDVQNTYINEFAEAYHKAEVEAISDEKIDNYCKNSIKNNFGKSDKRGAKYKELAIKWFKNQLLNKEQ